MALGKKIYEFAKLKNLSIKELARLADVPYTTLYSFVKRDGNKIDSEYLLRIAKVLGVDVYSIVDFETASDLFADSMDKLTLLYAENATVISRIAGLVSALNEAGQEKAVERVEELTEIPKYQK